MRRRSRPRRRLALGLALALASASAPALAADAPAAAPGASPIQLVKTPKFSLTPRAQYFIRGQTRLNNKFSPAPGDRASAVLQRVRLGLLAETGPLSVYAEFQDARAWGFEASTSSNEANVDLHQGYLELGGKGPRGAGSVRIGRQEIMLGSTRLFVDMHWNPVGQSFDAVRANGRFGKFGFDVAGIMLTAPTSFTIPDPGGDPALETKVQSRGSYVGFAQLSANLHAGFNLEGLLAGISERPTAARPTVTRDIANVGLRLHGAPLPGLLYDVEAYGQRGRNLGLPHSAWATFATLDYTFPRRLQPGLSLRYNYASGQACRGAPADGCGNARSGEFFRFFGLRHARYGIADLAAHSNIRSLEAGAHLLPHATVRLDLNYQFLQLDQPTGAWRDAANQLVGVGWSPTNRDRSLAHELDFTVTYRPLKQLFVQPGYALVVPLAGGRALAGPAPQHFAFLWLVAKI